MVEKEINLFGKSQIKVGKREVYVDGGKGCISHFKEVTESKCLPSFCSIEVIGRRKRDVRMGSIQCDELS